MLGREYRITEAKEFEEVRAKGNSFQSKNFKLGFFDRGDTSPTRFGFVIPVKVYKNASDRNRIKRVLSESVRHQLTFLKNGQSVVFLPRESLLRAYTSDVMKEVKDALASADLYK